MPYNLQIPGQISEAQLKAIEVVAKLVPEGGHVVEIGSLFGRSSWAWAKSVKPSVTVHCIDPWEGNEGIRRLEKQFGVTYGLEQFKEFTKDCPNVVAHKGYSPRDFSDWDIPVDLYYEDAVHTDPILSENLIFWTRHLRQEGIICGDDFRPRFADVINGVRRLSQQLDRPIVNVDFFWCLLPEPHVETREYLNQLGVEHSRSIRKTGPRVKFVPVNPISELDKQAKLLSLPFQLTNEGLEPWPDEAVDDLVIQSTLSSSNGAESITLIALDRAQLAPDIPVSVDIELNLEPMPVGDCTLTCQLLAIKDGAQRVLKTMGRLSVTIGSVRGAPPPSGDWAAIEPDARRGGVAQLRLDDVVHAYRWILGREPESSAKLEAHLGRAKTQSALRRIFLSSDEFGRQLSRMNITRAADRAAVAQIKNDSAAGPRLLFLHVPKTGGTSLHHHITAQFPERSIAEARHNDLLTGPLYAIYGKRLFSGHFDSRLVDLVGEKANILVVLREPRQRLFSVYRHLRATTPERAAVEGHTLAKAARQNDFPTFLEVAVSLNAGTVDNTYTRTLGASLPIARWETHAEIEWMKEHANWRAEQYQAALARAMVLLREQRTHVLSFDQLGEGIKSVFPRLELAVPEKVMHLKDSQRITEATVGFSPVDTEFVESDILLELTKYDSLLYAAAFT